MKRNLRERCLNLKNKEFIRQGNLHELPCMNFKTRRLQRREILMKTAQSKSYIQGVFIYGSRGTKTHERYIDDSTRKLHA